MSNEQDDRPTEAAGDDGLALPPSYLPGRGQSGSQRLTHRFGAADKLPGRSELDTIDEGRRGGGVKLALGLVVLLGGGGAAAWHFTQGGAQPPQPTPPPPVAQQPNATAAAVPSASQPAPEEVPDEEEAPVDPAPVGTADGPPATAEDQLVAQAAAAGSPEALVSYVRAWRDQGHDRKPGARRRLLEAIQGRIEESLGVGKVLLESLRDSPPATDEAIACLDFASPVLRRQLVNQLAATQGAEAEAAARAIRDRIDKHETEDLLLEESLLRLGYARPDAVRRLIDARGGALWAHVGGKELLEAVARADLAPIAPLLEHPDVEVRIVGCDLIAASGRTEDALRLLTAALRDEDARMRRRLVDALVTIGDPKASWPLARALLREEDRYTRDKLRDAFQRLPNPQTVTFLEQLFRRPQAQDRLAAVIALPATNRVEVVKTLFEALDDAERDVRWRALQELDTLYKLPAFRPGVSERLAKIRAIALDRADRDMSRVATNMHLDLTGRLPN